MGASAVQLVLAIIWICLHGITIKAVFLGVLPMLVVALLVGWRTQGEVKKGLWVMLFLITYAPILHTAVGSSTKNSQDASVISASDNDASFAVSNVAGLPDAPRGNIYELLMQRFTWPFLPEFTESYIVAGDPAYDFMPSIPLSAKEMWDTYFPAVEAFTPAADLNATYLDLSKKGAMYWKKANAINLLRDGCEYFFAPFTIEANLRGLPFSYSTENYADFAGSHLGFAKFYRLVCLGNLIVLGALAVLSYFTLCDKKKRRRGFRTFFIVATVVSLYCIFFPLRGFDYTNATYIIMAWVGIGTYLLS